MPQWRTERFPPPRVSQSQVSRPNVRSKQSILILFAQYDKVGLTRKLLISDSREHHIDESYSSSVDMDLRAWCSGILDLPIRHSLIVSHTLESTSQKAHIYQHSQRPEILRMAELSDSPDLQRYSTAVLYVISAITPPSEYVEVILNDFVDAIKSSAVSVRTLEQLSGLTSCAVVANPPPCPSRNGRILLPESIVHFLRECLEDHGLFACMSGR